MKKNSFINGALIATIGIVITKFLGIVYVIPFYAIIGEKNVALYGYAYTIYNLFLYLSTVGIPPAMSKLISEYNTLKYYYTKERTYKIGKYLLMGFGTLSFLVLFITAPYIATRIMGDATGGNSISDITFVIRVISTAILVVPYLSVTKGYLQGHKIMTPSSVCQVIEQVVRIIVIILGSYLCVKVFNLGVVNAIGVAVFGATIGALAALFYLLIKIRNNKKMLNKDEKITDEEKHISNKMIIKKLLIYSVPFISFGVSISLYDFIDMVTVVKALTHIGFKTVDAESILGVINTTGNKLNSVVLAISTGLVTSLVPNITSSFVKKDFDDVRLKVKNSFLMLLYVTLPMTIGLSFLADSVFYAFYGESIWGPKVFCLSIFIALFRCMYTTSISIAQSFNKFKNVFVSIILGLVVKAVLQVPLINLFNSLGLYPFYGFICASLIGISTAFMINFVTISKMISFNIKDFVKSLFKIIYPTIIMLVLLFVIKYFIGFNTSSRFMSIVYISIYGVLGAALYFGITIKNNVFKSIFGDKLFKKLKLKK